MSLIARFRRRLRQYRITATTATGIERMGEAPLSLLVFGHGIDLRYLLDRAYGSQPFELKAKRMWQAAVPRLLRTSRADLVIACNADPEFMSGCAGPGRLFLPRWVGGSVDVDSALALRATSRNVKTDIARVRKNRLSYEIATDPASCRWFYDNIYVPHIRVNFGEAGATAPYQALLDALPTSLLMFVTQDGERIAGQILQQEGDFAKGWLIGVRDGAERYTRLGALQALYAFSLEEAARRGVKRVSFGGSRPFLDDGVLQFKKKWGMVLADASPTGFLVLRINDTPGARAFLAHNPCICRDELGGLRGQVYIESDPMPPAHELDALTKKHSVNGLSSLDVRPASAAQASPT